MMVRLARWNKRQAPGVLIGQGIDPNSCMIEQSMESSTFAEVVVLQLRQVLMSLRKDCFHVNTVRRAVQSHSDVTSM